MKRIKISSLFILAILFLFSYPGCSQNSYRDNYMKPGAKLVIIDQDPDKWGNDDHFKTKDEILSIMKKTDFKLDKIETFLQRDNIYIFKIKN